MIWLRILLASSITSTVVRTTPNGGAGAYPLRGGEVQKEVVHYSCLWVRADHTVLATTAG